MDYVKMIKEEQIENIRGKYENTDKVVIDNRNLVFFVFTSQR